MKLRKLPKQVIRKLPIRLSESAWKQLDEVIATAKQQGYEINVEQDLSEYISRRLKSLKVELASMRTPAWSQAHDTLQE
ncbi:MAG: hypothetical protein ACSHXZ_14970 [Gammaproteobacteria bacterium]